MSAPWRQYQEEAAAFFRSLGLHAETDVTVNGVRTSHDVDIVIRSQHAGFEIVWLVECKLWQTPVNKLHVLGLREIVHDVGADRGIILAEKGFQSGAYEAATLTNVQLTSLGELRISAKGSIYAMRARELSDRIELCHAEYWEFPKQFRKEVGLRPHFAEMGYSGATVIDLSRDIMRDALRGTYPIMIGDYYPTIYTSLPRELDNFEDTVEIVDRMISELEAKLASAKEVFANRVGGKAR